MFFYRYRKFDTRKTARFRLCKMYKNKKKQNLCTVKQATKINLLKRIHLSPARLHSFEIEAYCEAIVSLSVGFYVFNL